MGRTFLPYLRGIDPEALRIGSLYLNPLNPDDGLEDKRFEFGQGIEQEEYEKAIKRYSWKEQTDDRGVSLEFAISKETAAGFHFSEWLHLEGEASGRVAAVLEGQKGRRLKLRYPQKFLKEQVMSQEGCDEWIRTQASISYKGKFGLHKWKAPEIWMVTGLQLVAGGDVYAAGSRDKKFEAGVGADPSVAAGLPPGTLKVKAEASQSHGQEANTGYGYEDERVWAAQFMEIELEYGDDEDIELQKRERSKDLLPTGIGGLRTETAPSRTPRRRARVIADEEAEIPEDTGDALFDEIPYAESLQGTSWTDYNECSRYLDDEARGSP